MSAVAHGWKPTGSAKDLPVSVAKKFHAADAGHKYGAGMHGQKGKPYANGGLAMRIARKYSRKRYADGGGDDDYDLPPEITQGRSIPRSPDFLPAWGRRAMPAIQQLPPDPDNADELRRKLLQRGLQQQYRPLDQYNQKQMNQQLQQPGMQSGGGTDYDSNTDWDTRWQNADFPAVKATMDAQRQKSGLFDAMANKATQMRQDMRPASFNDRFEYTPTGDIYPPTQTDDEPIDQPTLQRLLRQGGQGYQEGGDVPQLSTGAQALLDQHGSPEAAIQGGIQKLQQAYRSDTPYWSGVLNELRSLPKGGGGPTAIDRLTQRPDLNYQDGGDVNPDDLPDVGPPAIPSGPQISKGYSPYTNKLVDAASTVLGKQAADIGTLGPVRRAGSALFNAASQPLGTPEGRQASEDLGGSVAELGTTMMGGKGEAPSGTAHSFVGPYGAMMLRNAERESGENPFVHPVYSRQVNKATYSPETRGDMVDARDAMAQDALARGANDRDIFPVSGWSRDAAGNAVKEIPDTGAKLVHTGNGEYEIKHPAGNFHDIYDIPKFTFNRDMPVGNAATSIDRRTGTVVGVELGGKGANGVNDPRNLAAALHEMQHAISTKEGFPSGTDPHNLPFTHPDFPGQRLQESFADKSSQYTPSWWSPAQKEAAAKARAAGMPEDKIHKKISNYNIYTNESGETQARNVSNRFEQNLYRQHPEDTEDVGRGLQWQYNRWNPRSQEEVDKATEPQRKALEKDIIPPSPSGPPVTGGKPNKYGLDYSYRGRNGERGINQYGFDRQGYYRGKSDTIKSNQYEDPHDIARVFEREGTHGKWAQTNNGRVFNIVPQTEKGWANLPKSGHSIFPYITDKENYSPGQASGGRIPRFQSGGFSGGYKFKSNFNPERAAAFGLSRQSGMLHSSVPGRTDKLNLNVGSGSYVIPADVTSGLGQGNSLAGGRILDNMFHKGPFGMATMHGGSRSPMPKMGSMRMSSMSRMSGPGSSGTFGKSSFGSGFAPGGVPEGGDTTPIVAAGGEYIVHPDAVRHLGGGDIDTGHNVLDRFVKMQREKHIQTLKNLKPPKGSDEANGKASGGAIKLSKAAVHYTAHGHPDSRCGICKHFKDGHCKIVSGPISAAGWCNRFKKK
jgi:hypothetical protein